MKYFSTQQTSEEDNPTIVKLLYEQVETAYLNGKPLPNNITLMRTARKEFEVGLLEAKRYVDRMETENEKALKEMNYFPFQRKDSEGNSPSA